MPALTINGERREWADDAFPGTLTDLIADLGMDEQAVVAEVNGQILRQEEFGEFCLAPGMTVELVQFVGGG